jgi:pimeloyl-ACP methyl ester carboxylesterase
MENRKIGGYGFISGQWPLDPDKLTIFFIHGAALTGISWKPQLEALTEFANTVAVDLPGHGTTQSPAKDKVTDYTRSVMEFLDQVGAPRPVPCGLSLGGAITQQLLINHRDRFPAGILINTGARLRVNPMVFETIEKNYGNYLDMVCAFAISKKSDVGKIRPEIDASLTREADVALVDFRACDTFDVMETLSSIEVPVLVLTASDDLLTPPKYGTFLKDKIKNAELVNIEDAGHLSPLEKPDEVNDAIKDFLRRSL